MKRTLPRWLLLVLVSPTALTGWAAADAPLRDPTQPPPTFGAPGANTRLPIDMLRPEQLVTIDGVIYLIWNGRRYKTGDTIAGARIERVSESEVWLKSDGKLRKLPVFVGVEKRVPVSDTSINPPIRASKDRKSEPTK